MTTIQTQTRGSAPGRASAPRGRPTFGDEAEYAAATISSPAIYGPPVTFLLGPWLLLVLLLVPPFALLFVIALVLAVAAVAVVALGAVLASPYLLVRHLRADRTPRTTSAASRYSIRKLRVGFGRLISPHAKGVS